MSCHMPILQARLCLFCISTDKIYDLLTLLHVIFAEKSFWHSIRNMLIQNGDKAEKIDKKN